MTEMKKSNLKLILIIVAGILAVVMLDGNRNYDYGPYKLCKFFDPNTLEEIGKVMMHETSVEAFLDAK